MNRKLNSVLFIVGATVGNLILMVLLMGIALVLLSLGSRFIPPGVLSVLTVVLFIGSIAATYWIYHRLMRYLSTRYKLEDYFAPLFKRQQGPRKRPNDRD